MLYSHYMFYTCTYPKNWKMYNLICFSARTGDQVKCTEYPEQKLYVRKTKFLVDETTFLKGIEEIFHFAAFELSFHPNKMQRK